MTQKEEPILAGVPGGMPAWENEEQPLGGSWANWGGGPSTAPNSTVFSLSWDNADPGGVIVGGSFDSIGDTAIGRIAEFYGYEGWKTLGSGIQNGVVYCTLCAQSNIPIIFAGGTFMMAGSTPVHRIAMWDGTAWHPLGSDSSEGVDSTVLAMAVIGDSLYIGGNFTHAGGVLVNHIAIWNIATNQWESIVDSGVVGVDGGVAALLVPREEDILYVGGGFLRAGATIAPKIAGLSQGHWSSLGSGIHDTDGIVEALCEGFQYGNLSGIIAGGHFSRIGDSIASDVAHWNTNDSNWQPIKPFQKIQGTVYSLTNPVDLYVGGNFLDSTNSAQYIAEVGYSNTAPQVNGPVYALLGEGGIFPEGSSEDIYIGGVFSTPVPYFARWNEGAGVAMNAARLNSEISIFPNPVTDYSTIRIQLANSGFVSLELYNSLGEKITTFCQNTLDAGPHDFHLNATQCQPGNGYFVVLNLSGNVSTYKLIVN